jgi:hypothetical protein
MSDTTTPNYGFDLPTVGASQDTWGGKLNANFVLADSAIHGLASGYLPISGGGTINGNLAIAPTSGYASLALSKPTGANGNQIEGATAGRPRWALLLGDATAESGGNAGSNFSINRFDDSGSYLGTPLSINRANGNVSIQQSLFVNGGVYAAGGRIMSTGAGNNPSVAVYNTSVNWAGGWWVGAAGALQFGTVDAGGSPNNPYGYLSNTSLGFAAGTVSIEVNTGANSLCYGSGTDFNVPGQAWKPGGGPWAALSDDRVKRNVRPYSAGLADICELAPIRFEYNGDGGSADDGVTRYGLSAQATQPVMPELVHEMPVSQHSLPGQLATDLGPLTLALVNAVRELAERVASLELQG